MPTSPTLSEPPPESWIVPPHVLVVVTLLRLICAGRVGKTSVKAGLARLTATLLVLLRVKVRVLVPPLVIVLGLKLLAIVGASLRTVRLGEGGWLPAVCV